MNRWLIAVAVLLVTVGGHLLVVSVTPKKPHLLQDRHTPRDKTEISPERRFGVEFPPGGRLNWSGGGTDDWWNFSGHCETTFNLTHDAAVAFYEKRYGKLRPLKHVDRERLMTSLDWRDVRGYVTVLLTDDRPVDIVVIRAPAQWEVLSDRPARVPRGYSPPRKLGLKVYPGAHINYSGYVPGIAARMAKAEYETTASLEEVEAFYERNRGARRGDTYGWGNATMMWARFAAEYTADMRQADPALPTIVRVTRTPTSLKQRLRYLVRLDK